MPRKKLAEDDTHQILAEIRDALVRQCQLYEESLRQTAANNEKYWETQQAERERAHAQLDAVNAENRSNILKTQNHLKFMRFIQVLIAALFIFLLAVAAGFLAYFRPFT